MAIRDNFSADEWKTLLGGPALAAAAVVAASPGGTLGEMYGTLAGLREGMANANSDLVNGLLAISDDEAKQMGSLPPLPTEPAAARATALTRVQAAATLASEKAASGAIPASEAVAYKQFLYEVADRVANSGKEGAFLGLFGGVKVNDAERAVLGELAGLLGVTPPTPSA
ncbi:MAG TPA: hypothetical protein VM490_15920 [Armatimonadaceae bacterium]|nr:hypothetical protein [Armatimonadaceae bacterium]